MKLALTGKSDPEKDYLVAHLIGNYGFIDPSISDQIKKLAHTVYP